MEIRVRNVDPWVISFLRDEAEHAGHSLAEHVRQYLRDAALKRRNDWAAELAAGREEIQKAYGVLSDSTEGIRRDREERG
jgi:plasmid stability protein